MAELAFDPQGPAVQLDEPLRETEPEAGALCRTPGIGAGLTELLEDPGLVGSSDADARVSDGDGDAGWHPLAIDGHRASARSELDRVDDEVEEHLPDLPLVGGHGAERRVHRGHDERHAALCCAFA